VDYRFSLAGLLVGFLIGLTGMGGGSLLAPILILFLRVPPLWAVATDITTRPRPKGWAALSIFANTIQFSGSFLAGLWECPGGPC